MRELLLGKVKDFLLQKNAHLELFSCKRMNNKVDYFYIFFSSSESLETAPAEILGISNKTQRYKMYLIIALLEERSTDRTKFQLASLSYSKRLT